MVVNKSSATNKTAPAAKEKYAASTITLVTARLFVMTVSCVWKGLRLEGANHLGASPSHSRIR